MKLINGLIFIITYTEITGQSDISWGWIVALIAAKICEAAYYLTTAKEDEDKFEGI